MKTLKDKVAAITGAGSGIGRATALHMADHGCHLAISDIDEHGLAQTAEAVRSRGGQVHTTKLDVSDREAVYGWADEVADRYQRVHIILNNAGVGLGATVEHMSYEDFHWLMNINFWGVVHGTKAFLPHIKRAGEGAIVNISSVFGLIGVPTQSAYNAAKFAVKGFTEALRTELEVEGVNIGVTCVHPGGIKTNIARSARLTETKGMVDPAMNAAMEKAFITPPEKAAEAIVSGILKNRRRLLIGPDAYVIEWLQRVLGAQYQHIVIANGRRQRQAALTRAGQDT